MRMSTFCNFKKDNIFFLNKWRQKAENRNIVSSEKKKSGAFCLCSNLQTPFLPPTHEWGKGIEIKVSSKMWICQLYFTLLYHDNIKLKLNKNCQCQKIKSREQEWQEVFHTSSVSPVHPLIKRKVVLLYCAPCHHTSLTI